MALIRWSYTPREDFTVRGWHSPPSGKPLLHFLHGNSFCGRVYEPMLQHLSEHFDLWLSDIQGHGDSDHGPKFLGWNRNADIALEAFKHHRSAFGDVPNLALGHSFGGVLTCLMMASDRHLFKRAVVLDPVIFPAAMALAITMAEGLGLSGQNPLAKGARKRRNTWPDRSTALDTLRGRGVYNGWHDDALKAFVDHALKDAPDGSVELKCSPEREAQIFSSAPTGLWTALRQIKAPTLMMHGENTFDFVRSSGQLWADSNPQVTLRPVDGGHCFMQERPQEAAHAVSDFLRHQD
jgi:pimeloyl-ACP methyl ester carboxylesterase